MPCIFKNVILPYKNKDNKNDQPGPRFAEVSEAGANQDCTGQSSLFAITVKEQSSQDSRGIRHLVLTKEYLEAAHYPLLSRVYITTILHLLASVVNQWGHADTRITFCESRVVSGSDET